jgi:hypothetical protein
MSLDWNLSYLPDAFGPLYMGGSVEVAMIRTLEEWLPTYVAEINRQLGAPILTVPQSYLYQPTERPIAPKTSQSMVIVPGTIGVPERKASVGATGQGATRATFDARVSVFFGGTQDFNESRAVGNAYAAAVTGAIAQNPSLGGFAEITKWHGYNVASEGRSSTYWRMTTIVRFGVTVANVMSPFGGIPTPSVLAPAAPIEVDYVGVTVEQEA